MEYQQKVRRLADYRLRAMGGRIVAGLLAGFCWIFVNPVVSQALAMSTVGSAKIAIRQKRMAIRFFE